MKTLEDLELMTVDQLKGIATSLGVDVKANIRKPELVQLVYDVQQPDAPDPEDSDTAEDQDRPIDTEDQIELYKKEIADHFDGELSEDGETEDGAVIYVVTDIVEGDEVARGTLLELYEQVQTAPPAEDFPDDDLGDVPLDVDPEVHTTPEVKDDDAVERIKAGLAPLAAVGLKYQIDGSVIRLQAGSKKVTTTLNQPAHRVVKTAEQLCKFR